MNSCRICGWSEPDVFEITPGFWCCVVCQGTIRPGDKTVPGGDVMWDGTIWDRIKGWFRR